MCFPFVRHLIAATVIWMLALPAQAVTFLRDSEIEFALSELARPILNAAGLPGHTKIIVIQDRSLNAFVVDTRAIYLHSGLILELESAAQLQSVIAHEAAHIANGHLTRRLANQRSASTLTTLGFALAAVAAASGNGDAAGGIALGTTGSAQRNYLAHTRSEESAADQSSFRYLRAAGVDTSAAVEVLNIFRGQEALSVSRQDPYARSHPLTRDRIRAFEGLVAGNPSPVAESDTADYWFARAQGKLSAFTQNPSWTLRRTRGATDTISLMRQAVAHHRVPNTERAMAAINALVAARPNDPFVHELKGQILLESRQAAGAVAAYARAIELAPSDALILASYGRALLALDTADGNRRALSVLEQSRARDDRNANMLRDLGLAYARNGQNGQASLAVAERYALRGRFSDAAIHAQRAVDQLPRGSASWQRAQDVLRTAEQISGR